jgi:hypothetical protein
MFQALLKGYRLSWFLFLQISNSVQCSQAFLGVSSTVKRFIVCIRFFIFVNFLTVCSVQRNFRWEFYANQRTFTQCLKFFHLQCLCSILKISSSVQCALIFGENYAPFRAISTSVQILTSFDVMPCVQRRKNWFLRICHNSVK